MKVIKFSDPRMKEDYFWVEKLFPNAVVVEHKDGVFRFKGNHLIRHLIDHCKHDLNALWTMYHNEAFNINEMMEVYMGMGYSLSGFDEVFGEEITKRLDKLEEKQ